MQTAIPPIALSLALLCAGVASAAVPNKCGDVNENGQINASDALATLRAAVGDAGELDCGPRGKLPRTGQQLCYDSAGAEIACEGTGQDGELLRGIARSSVDNDDGTILDEVTGLEWEKLSDDGSIHDRDNTYDWQNAFDDKVEALNAADFAEHNDWRLPNAFELYTLANLGRSAPAYHTAHFDRHCEPECNSLDCSCTPASLATWSSTTNDAEREQAWLVSSFDGALFPDDKTDLYGVRVVRGGFFATRTGDAAGSAAAAAGSPCGDVDKSHTVTASDALAILKAAVGQPIVLRCSPRAETLQTGQTSCYDAEGEIVNCGGKGQDGELETGAPRYFIDNGDGTVTDQTTGLMWEKLSNDGSIHDRDDLYTWGDAFTVKVAGLNAAMFAGHANWRMPGEFELATLDNLGESGPAVYSPYFASSCPVGCSVTVCGCNPASSETWSSTTYAAAPQMAWYVDFTDGRTLSRTKTGLAHVRAVRLGN